MLAPTIWKGHRPTPQLLKNALRNELGLPIARIEFAALNGAPEESIHFVHDGVAYDSLTPAHRMRVSYAAEDGFTSLFSIGQTDAGSWRIVCAANCRPADPGRTHAPTLRRVHLRLPFDTPCVLTSPKNLHHLSVL